jgi:hypothetical protein
MAFLFDRESVAIEDLRSRISLSRRRMLRIGAVSLAAAPISVRLLGAQAQSCGHFIGAVLCSQGHDVRLIPASS